MGYLVLTRKYRPQNFNEVIGQQHVSRTLMSALKDGRVGHSYLFAGPRGVGKTSVARILAKAVNCEKGVMQNPCNECGTCKAITKGNSVDVIEIDGASNRGIDEIRDLRAAVSYIPSQTRYKIYIIDEVHMLTKEAFNALLKTLEEPPSHVIFIFATTEPQKVPKTVLSRCQRFDFRLLTEKEIFQKLKKLIELESVEADDESLSLIASRAEGAIRDAEGMLEQLISYSKGKITSKDVREVFGFIGDELYIKLFKGISTRDEASIIEGVEEVVQKGCDLMEFTSGWLKFLRRLLLCNLRIKDPTTVEVNENVVKLAKSVSVEFITAALNLSADLEKDIKNISYSPIYLELAMLRMAQIPDLRDINALIEEISKPSSKEKKHVEPSQGESTINYRKTEVEPREVWERIVQAINGTRGNNFLKVFLKDADVVSFNNNCLRLRVSSTHKEHLKENIGFLKEAGKDVMGEDIEIDIIASEKPVEKALRAHPMVKKIKEIFNAEEYI
ncbi:MAG: DNA polymerase III subunit gamma/tau [candidate division WOR-3 bacterium]|nr:DNA polymerase III subunit gamma/tau [candidate division WOR-3 bacterium]